VKEIATKTLFWEGMDKKDLGEGWEFALNFSNRELLRKGVNQRQPDRDRAGPFFWTPRSLRAPAARASTKKRCRARAGKRPKAERKGR